MLVCLEKRSYLRRKCKQTAAKKLLFWPKKCREINLPISINSSILCRLASLSVSSEKYKTKNGQKYIRKIEKTITKIFHLKNKLPNGLGCLIAGDAISLTILVAGSS